jgi:hypothetical protein
MPEQAKTPEDLRNRLIVKAWEDDAFKEALLSDPKASIEKELEVTLPAELNIRVVEETEDTIYLVLPVNPEALPEGEVSEDELEAVAGGALTATREIMAAKFAGFGGLRKLTFSPHAARRQ